MPNDDTTMVLYIYFGCFWLLAHLTGDLSQAEQMHKMATISLKMVEVKIVVIFLFAQLVTTVSFFSQLEFSHVIKGSTPQNQHRNREPM